MADAVRKMITNKLKMDCTNHGKECLAKDFLAFFEAKFRGLEGLSFIALEQPAQSYSKPKKVELEEPERESEEQIQ